MIKIVIILIYLSNKVFNAVIDYLNRSYLKKELPDNVKDVYSEEEYRKFLAYRTEGRRLSSIKNILSIVFTLALLVFNVYALLFDAVSGLNEYVQYLLIVVMFAVFDMLTDMPFEYYDTFVIEEKYGLNKTTKKTFVLDQIKSIVIEIALSYGYLILIKVLFEKFGNMAIIWSTLAVLAIVVVVMLIIVPLMKIFNKFEPLEEGELKNNISSMCDKYGIKIKKIVVRDASRRTTTSNAFCTGIGNRKTISFDDNLINSYSVNEITAVFAHEFAHAKYRHTIKGLPFSIVRILILFVSLAIVLNIPALYTAFGFTGVNFYFATLMSGVIIWPVSKVMDIIGNYLSRKHEFQADAFAAREGYGADLISALKRLNKESLSGINPHPAMVVLSYSHPTLSKRIEAIEKENLKQV